MTTAVTQRKLSAYEQWMQSVRVPIHRGYSIPDLRTIELGPWPDRGCDAAFLVLAGQEGVSEARVSEIGPGSTSPQMKFVLDEAVYVVEGRGLTTVWPSSDGSSKAFEWSKHSVFMVPRNCTFQLSNMDGSKPARLLHYNYLPVVMEFAPDRDFLFGNPYTPRPRSSDGELYDAAQAVTVEEPSGTHTVWRGNFFPDMATWDKLYAQGERGVGSRTVALEFPDSPIRSHMAVFSPRTYKKAHRHGPGILIVVLAGEGYSVMWPEGQDKLVFAWQEGSVFVPPDRMFHQHFNIGGRPARYLALKMPDRMRMSGERMIDPARDQIEYPDEDPWIRRKFEDELAKRGLTSQMPEQAYRDATFKWRQEGGA